MRIITSILIGILTVIGLTILHQADVDRLSLQNEKKIEALRAIVRGFHPNEDYVFKHNSWVVDISPIPIAAIKARCERLNRSVGSR